MLVVPILLCSLAISVLICTLSLASRLERGSSIRNAFGSRAYGPTQGHPLSLAARERLGFPVEETLDGENPCGLVHAPADLGLVQLPQLEGEAHVLPHVHVRVEGVVLEDHGYVALARRKVVDDLIPY